MKRCPKCGRNKRAALFHRNANNSDGLHGWCKACRKRFESDYQTSRSQILMRDYGITEDDYKRMLANQNGVCSICEEACIRFAVLCVDHDHDTGRVRGLLCSRCNQGIGLFRNSIPFLLKAASYLANPDT